MPGTSSSVAPRILIYILRYDLRISDNPIFHDLSRLTKPPFAYKSSTSKWTQTDRSDAPALAEALGVTHLLPLYIFPADQVEISGFLSPSSSSTAQLPKSPYPEAKSRIGKFWRTGPHRATFIAESVWALKQELEALGCGTSVVIRVGAIKDIVENIVSWFAGEVDDDGEIVGVWMTSVEGTEEKKDERDVRQIAKKRGFEFKAWMDEKYFVDDRDLPFSNISDLPNVYTTYRKSLEPLYDRPRRVLRTPTRLPPLPLFIPPQPMPFSIPSALDDLKSALLTPLNADPSFGLPVPPRWPQGTESAHPFTGGERAANARLKSLISSGAMSRYKDTRNGMLGTDFSTKLSAYLAFGCLTARQVHWALVDFESGSGRDGIDAMGFGKGENEGTKAVRFELLWRDYMRLCARKFGPRLFHVDGFRGAATESPQRKRWKYLDRSSGMGDDPIKTREIFIRFLSGTTGMGLIDASQRELFLTGYTSNRARQNVASFLAAHLGIDWRLGAEWYESMLIDYDAANNWGNWQYVAGVGNDPRQGRVFNPVKQALEYDPNGHYIRAWVGELRGVNLRGEKDGEVDQEKLMGVFQAWRMKETEKEQLGIRSLDWVEWPLIRIPFSISRARGADGGGGSKRGRGRGGYRGRGKGRGSRRSGDGDQTGRMAGGNELNSGDA
ncbi:cryptochrome [Glonium stellatum]|uniref:Cryptochrome DASH n=1 Tax=Glonium stellatum TaxID=574774 RepID=A0A8E2ERQ3_9PEZI|nr:cryptochrome [Glonium stellatum]